MQQYKYYYTKRIAAKIRSFYRNVAKNYRHTYSYENMEQNVRQKIKNRSLLNLSGFHYCNRVGNYNHLISIQVFFIATIFLRRCASSFTPCQHAVFLL